MGAGAARAPRRRCLVMAGAGVTGAFPGAVPAARRAHQGDAHQQAERCEQHHHVAHECKVLQVPDAKLLEVCRDQAATHTAGSRSASRKALPGRLHQGPRVRRVRGGVAAPADLLPWGPTWECEGGQAEAAGAGWDGSWTHSLPLLELQHDNRQDARSCERLWTPLTPHFGGVQVKEVMVGVLCAVLGPARSGPPAAAAGGVRHGFPCRLPVRLRLHALPLLCAPVGCIWGGGGRGQVARGGLTLPSRRLVRAICRSEPARHLSPGTPC
jgi:hypothetical protein